MSQAETCFSDETELDTRRDLPYVPISDTFHFDEETERTLALSWVHDKSDPTSHASRSRKERRMAEGGKIDSSMESDLLPLRDVIVGRLLTYSPDERAAVADGLFSSIFLNQEKPETQRFVAEWKKLTLELAKIHDIAFSAYYEHVHDKVHHIDSSEDLYYFARDFSGVDIDEAKGDIPERSQDIWKMGLNLHETLQGSQDDNLVANMIQATASGEFDREIVKDLFTSEDAPQAVQNQRELLQLVGGDNWLDTTLTIIDRLPVGIQLAMNDKRTGLLNALKDTEKTYTSFSHTVVKAMGADSDYIDVQTDAVAKFRSAMFRLHGARASRLQPRIMEKQQDRKKRQADKNRRASDEPVTPESIEANEEQQFPEVNDRLYNLFTGESSEHRVDDLVVRTAKNNTQFAESLTGCIQYIVHHFSDRSRQTTGIKRLVMLSTREQPVWEFKPGEAKGLPVRTADVRSHRVIFTFEAETNQIHIVGIVDRSDLTQFIRAHRSGVVQNGAARPSQRKLAIAATAGN